CARRTAVAARARQGFAGGRVVASNALAARLVVCACRAPRLECPHHAVRVEALRGEIAIQLLELTVVGDRRARSKTFVQRRLDQRVLVDGRKRILDRAVRGARRDAGALELHLHAKLAAAATCRLVSRDRLRHASVVYRALRTQPRDRRIDGALVVSAASEALTYLE